ncbi:MAG: hypothetical protein CM15mV42_0960 [uncultured marine virus]|nr:MAG: hypothetical protein CM15mV42_0960 [uncultured marine virus]
MAQINQNDNEQYYNSIVNGGTIRVNQNINGEYMAYTQMHQYNPGTGGYDLLAEQAYNLNEFVYNKQDLQIWYHIFEVLLNTWSLY